MNNQLQPTSTKAVIPKLEDLYNDVELATKQNELNKLLNCAPNEVWLKPHPTATVKINGVDAPARYMPIERVEFLLTAIYLDWTTEIKCVQIIANSVVVTVRLGVKNPITGEWQYHDGVGAAPVNTKKGAAATDFTQIMHNSVQTAAPAAETYAIKDAAEKLGKLFGKDVNRSTNIDYVSALDKKFPAPGEKNEIPEELKLVIAEADKENLTNIYNSNPHLHSNAEFMNLLNTRKLQLNASRNKQPSNTH
jgi:hypothetical protein